MRVAVVVVIVAWLVLAVPRLALAYIDPGASSMAYQVLVAGALALGFALRRYWRQIADAVRRRRPPRGGSTDESGPNSTP